MAERARKGGAATARKQRAPGLDPDELPPLRTHEHAKAWLEAVGRAVATRRLPHNEGRVVVQAVAEWVKTHAEELTAEVAGELRTEVERLTAQLKGGSKARLRVD